MSNPEPAAPDRGRREPWVVVGLTLVALLVGATVLGRPVPPPATGAAAWLPADGHRGRLAAGASTAGVEWSRPSAFSLVQTASPQFWVWAEVTAVPWDTADYLRAVTHLLDPDATSLGSGEAMWVLDDTGARQVLDRAPDGESLVFEPGLLDLPASLRPGDTWTSDGELALRPPGAEWTVHSYQASYQALPADDPVEAGRGCVRVARELGFADQVRSGEQTWCPGAGMIATSQADTRWAPTDRGPAPPVPAATPFDWNRLDGLEFTSSTLNQVGTGVSHVSPVAAPGIQPDGRVVFANQVLPDVFALDPSTDPAPLSWHGRPGGTPTTAGTFGGLTVVATSTRGVVAYGPDGQWLWEGRLSDVTRVPPVLLGDTVVFVTLDGRVTALDLATGVPAWQTDLGGEIRRPPIVAGNRLVVGDQTGALTCLDATGSELWAVDAGVALSLAASTGNDPVVIVGRDASPVLQAYRVSDGSRAWRTRHYDDPREIVALDGSFVLRDADRTTAVDAATGRPLWSWSGARTWAATGGGDRVLLLSDPGVVLLDGDGRELRTWPHALGDLSQSGSYLTAGDGVVVAYGPLGMAIGRLP